MCGAIVYTDVYIWPDYAGDTVHVGDGGMCACMCTYMSVVNREPQHLPSSGQIIMLPASSAPEARLPPVPGPTPTLISYLWVVPTPVYPVPPPIAHHYLLSSLETQQGCPPQYIFPRPCPLFYPTPGPASVRGPITALGVSLSSCVCPRHNLEVPRGQGLGNFWIPELWVQAWAQEAPRGS